VDEGDKMTLGPLALRLGALLLGIAACGPSAPAPSGLSQQDQAALRALIAKLPQIVRARDWDALTAEYTEDGWKMPPNQPLVQGRAAIRQEFEELPPIPSFDFRIIDLDGRADLAVLRGAYHITYAPPGAARAISDSGKEVVVLRKQADGSWLRVGDIWNSDLPPRK